MVAKANNDTNVTPVLVHIIQAFFEIVLRHCLEQSFSTWIFSCLLLCLLGPTRISGEINGRVKNKSVSNFKGFFYYDSLMCLRVVQTDWKGVTRTTSQTWCDYRLLKESILNNASPQISRMRFRWMIICTEFSNPEGGKHITSQKESFRLSIYWCHLAQSPLISNIMNSCILATYIYRMMWASTVPEVQNDSRKGSPGRGRGDPLLERIKAKPVPPLSPWHRQSWSNLCRFKDFRKMNWNLEGGRCRKKNPNNIPLPGEFFRTQSCHIIQCIFFPSHAVLVNDHFFYVFVHHFCEACHGG
jgi:hypothetical protein